MQQALIVKKNRYVLLLWLLPLCALIGGVWLAYDRLNSYGPTINITFKTAEGLSAGSTKIRYKSLDIGTVESIEFSEDSKSIIVGAQMLKTAESLLKKDALFWVVKPQISASGIKGLQTILSGSYIAVDPGESKEKSNSYIGLETPPPVNPSEPGLRILLHSDTAKGVNVGTPIYYSGIKVGQIDQVKYQLKRNRVEISAFIRAPYNELISNQTKFWRIPGFSFELNSSGVSYRLESLETLLLGGITFNTATTLSDSSDSHYLKPNKIFTLYKNERASQVPSGLKNEYYVVYFDQGVRGLSVGAPVLLNGIGVGEVIDVRLIYDAKIKQSAVPILLELKPERIDSVNSSVATKDDLIKEMVEGGLYAVLESGNLITGEKVIGLRFESGRKNILRDDEYSNFKVLPSRDVGFGKLTDDVSALVAKVQALPLDDLIAKAENFAENANDSMAAINTILRAPEIQSLPQTLQNALMSVNKIGNNASNILFSLQKQLETLSAQLEETLYGISPESSLYYSLQNMINTLNRTAQSVDNVARKINAKPNALIFGD